jgi:hypothetical protein
MSRLPARFPNFGDVFDGNAMRAFITHLENLFARIDVDTTGPAYPVTAGATLVASDEVVLVDTTGGNITMVLPGISDSMVRTKREFEVVKIAAANTMTLDCTGADTIVGEPDAVVTEQWTALRVRATTGNWVLV